jgi:chromosome partitioning protein
MHILAIANQKGGVGKTTLCCLLAFYLADRHHARVAAIDVDNQRNLSHTLRQFRLEIASTSLFEDAPIDVPAARKGIALFHATPQLAALERATAKEANQRVRTFAAQVEALERHFDYCVIDPPPTLGVRMIATLACAEFVVMPIELEEYSTEGVKDMLQTVFGARQQWNPRLKFLGILANRFTHNSLRQRAAASALFEHFPQFVLPFKISTRAAIPRALEEGIPVWKLPQSAARDATTEVLQAFDAVMKAMNPESAPASEHPA